MATVTDAAADHYERIQALQAVTVSAGRCAWANIDERNIASSWRSQLPTLTSVTASSLTLAAESGAEYGVLDMAQRGSYVAPSAFVNPSAFGAAAPSGVPLETALTAPAVRVLGWISDGYDAAQALTMGRSLLDGTMRTFVSDSARQAASVDIATRPGVGYVRMLNPPSCDSCAILAGRFYRWNAGFLRHPRCDCIHRPSSSVEAAKSEGLIGDPYEYFNGLSKADQNRIFGQYKAQAIRDGGDIYRVQNSWRGRDGLYTAEGTSRRGFASSLNGQRLTPEGIYRTAGSRDEALELLSEHGYLLDAGQVSGGSILGSNYTGYGALGRGGTRVGASRAVDDATVTGIRDPNVRATMTEAERRLFDARMNYETALAGDNPYGRGPATALHKAQAEVDYRRWLASGGQIYTS